MPKVDPDTHQMLDDSPDNPDDARRGGKTPGDPALHDTTHTGDRNPFSSETTGGEESTGALPGEKPVRD